MACLFVQPHSFGFFLICGTSVSSFHSTGMYVTSMVYLSRLTYKILGMSVERSVMELVTRLRKYVCINFLIVLD
jgi:hypothetical protein